MKHSDNYVLPKILYNKEINNNILFPQYEFNTLQYLVIEQNANLTYFQHTLQEVNFYNYSWKIFFRNLKNYKKIKHSVKLRTKYYTTNIITINHNVIESQLLNFNLQRKKKNFLFLNKWGRFKFLKIKILIWYYLYYFYNTIFFTDPSFFFKKRKSLDKKLFCLSISNFFFKKEFESYYFATLHMDSFMDFFNIKKKKNILKISKKKPRLYRSIPRTKIWIALSLKKEFFVDFLESNFSEKIINYKLNENLIKLFFNTNLHDFNFFFKTNLHDFNFFFNINLIGNLNSYFFLFIQFLSFNYCLDFLLVFADILFFLNKNNIYFNSKNNIYWYFYLLPITSLNLNIKFKFKEWFINSYGKKNNFWMQKFTFFTGLLSKFYFKNDLLITKFNLTSFFLNDKNLEVFVFLEKLSYAKKLRFKIKYYSYTKFSNLISWIKFCNTMLLFLEDQPLFFNSNLILKFKLFDFNWFNPLKSNNLNFFTLSLITNYSLLFNNFQYLDTISSFLHNNFFNYSSLYNLIFFYKFFFKKIFTKKIQAYFYINTFEYIFFKKFLLFTSQSKSATIFYFSFWTFANCSFFQKFQHWRRFVKFLKWRFWFIPRIFIEEITHLSIEYLHGDFERVQEYIRTKQLAELRLNKLTDYLKKMWSLKIDAGNIQYSPDFTEKHEFALTLRWGVELEMLKFTRIIIMRRFFGKIGLYQAKENLIWRKINFLYNLIKPKILLEPRLNNLTVRVEIPKILSLKNVYELTRIQLATVIACYWNTNWLKMYQLSTFHRNFNLIGEKKVSNVYNFFFSIFSWYFLIDTYWKYYKKTKIKKKIWIYKMVRKKVYKWFMLSINFFKILFFKKNSYNYYYFSKFKNFKTKILKDFKSWHFYNMLFNLLFKRFRSFLLPVNKTLEDYKIYLLELTNLNLNFTNKLFLINNIDSYTNDEFFHLNFFPKLKIFNTKFKILKNNFLTFKKQKKNIFFKKKKILKNIFFFWSLDSTLINFFSEYIYEKFLEFSILMKPKKNFFSKNNFSGSKLFNSITSTSFSTSFYFFLNSSSLKISNKKFKNYENWVFLSQFDIFLLSSYQIKKFTKKLWQFFILNPLFQNEQILNKKINLYSSTSYLISLLTILNNNFLSWKFILQATTSVLHRFINFSDADLSTVFLKQLHFDSMWLKNFTKHLGFILINFLSTAISELLNNK